MAPKKGKKKKDDDWEDEAFDMVAENEIKTEAEVKPAADDDEDFFGGAAKKKVSPKAAHACALRCLHLRPWESKADACTHTRDRPSVPG